MVFLQDVQAELLQLRQDLDRLEDILQQLDMSVSDLSSVSDLPPGSGVGSYADIIARHQRLVCDVHTWVSTLDDSALKQKQFDVS